MTALPQRPQSPPRQLADLMRRVFRLERAILNAGGGETNPDWAQDDFTTSASQFRVLLSYVPVDLSEGVFLNGVRQRRDVDYTISLTGRITFTSIPATGSEIDVHDQHEGVVPDTSGSIYDNFDRANSTTGLGTASDGGAWIEDNYSGATPPVFGITSNKAVVVSGSGTGSWARRNLGKADQDISVIANRTLTNGIGIVYFGVTPKIGAANGTFYYLAYDSSTTFTIRKWVTSSTVLATFSGDVFGTVYGGGVPSLLRVTYDGAGAIAVYQDGVLLGTYDDSGSSPLTGTWVGFGNTQNYDTWDDFEAV